MKLVNPNLVYGLPDALGPLALDPRIRCFLASEYGVERGNVCYIHRPIVI